LQQFVLVRYAAAGAVIITKSVSRLLQRTSAFQLLMFLQVAVLSEACSY